MICCLVHLAGPKSLDILSHISSKISPVIQSFDPVSGFGISEVSTAWDSVIAVKDFFPEDSF